jgi:beta-lactamase superfamily II metal-dependent hydrolase
MLAIRMLLGGHGDALVIEYGTRAKTHRVLVDGGTVNSWDATVKRALLDLPNQRFEAFIVTHIDEDHIGGAIKLLVDLDLRHRVYDVWFNGFIHCNKDYRDDVLGPIDGERLTYRIGRGDFRWNAPFPGRVSENVGGPIVVSDRDRLPRIQLPGGAVVHLLSPTQPKLDKLAKVWEDVVVDAGLDPGKGTPLEARNPPTRPHEVVPLPSPLTKKALEDLARPSPPDPSKANGSSIAFILEYDGHRAFLGADAHADVLVQSLHVFAKSLNVKRVPLDLVKLPHHGSKANVSTTLIDAIEAKNYLVSTNGDNHGHPDQEAIARIILASNKPPTIYCNYRTAFVTEWAEKGPSVGATFVLPKTSEKPWLRVPATA